MLEQEILNILGWASDELLNLQFIAFSYIKQGKYAIAASILEGLQVLEPSNVYILQTLGALCIELGNPYKALDLIEKALNLDPTNELCRYNKVQALISLGLKKQAFEECEHLKLATSPNLQRKAEAILLSATLD
jgi:predicted Zn-dependent protease